MNGKFQTDFSLVTGTEPVETSTGEPDNLFFQLRFLLTTLPLIYTHRRFTPFEM